MGHQPHGSDLKLRYRLRIGEARKQVGFGSAAALGRKTGLSPATICKYENNRGGVNYQTLAHIADCMGVPIDSLVERRFGNVEPPAAPPAKTQADSQPEMIPSPPTTKSTEANTPA
jgi:transcriptional regulator with XRE-family HTH domain